MELMRTEPLSFVNLSDDENLYDYAECHCKSVVTARYYRRPGCENNPDICALPRTFTKEEIYDASHRELLGYDPFMIAEMKPYERKNGIMMLQNYLYPLNHTFEIAQFVCSGLRTSYLSREARISERNYNSDLTDEGLDGNVYLLKEQRSGGTSSFFVYGPSGSGKSVAIRTICSMYPSAIRHEIADKEYVQIPVLLVTCTVGNLSEMICAFGNRIDEILDTGTHHADKVRTKNISAACGILKQWIKIYHIGMLIIDEVQFMTFGPGRTSFENIISISEETGCAFGLIGNQDAYEKLVKYPRIMRRVMQNVLEINMAGKLDKYFFEAALREMWMYQWTDKKTELTEELTAEILKDCVYNISLLKALLIHVQFAAVSKYPKGGITVKYVHDISEKKIAQMRVLIGNSNMADDKKFLEMFASAFGTLKGLINKERMADRETLLHKSDKAVLSDDDRHKISKVVTVLQYNDGYSEYEISKAIKLAGRDGNEFLKSDIPDIVELLRKQLRSMSNHPDMKVKVSKNKRVDTEAEQAVQEAMRSELERKGGVA